VTSDGPGLSLFDANGGIRAGLRVTSTGSGLDLFDANGRTIWSAP
jgi:hypothetical protein